MNTRTIRLRRCSAPACAAMITAVSAWAFVNSTASGERDPFQFASIMAAHAHLRIAQTAASHGDPLLEELPDYGPPDLLAPPPLCLGRCC
jgi:hypothetical protein